MMLKLTQIRPDYANEDQDFVDLGPVHLESRHVVAVWPDGDSGGAFVSCVNDSSSDDPWRIGQTVEEISYMLERADSNS